MSTKQPPAADAAAIGKLVDDLSSAWSRGDAAGMAALYQEDGTFTNVFGAVHFGRAAFEERHRFILTGPFKGAQTTMRIQRLRLVLTKDAAEWSIAGFHNVSVGLPPAAR